MKTTKKWNKAFLLGMFSIVLTFEMIIAGCASAPAPKFAVTLAPNANKSLVDIQIVPQWNPNSLGPLAPAGIQKFTLTVKNLSNDSIRIVWNKCTFFYDGNSYRFWVKKYFEYNDQNPTVLPVNASMTFELYSSAQTYHSTLTNSTAFYTITAEDIATVTCIESNGKEFNYNMSLKKLATETK